MITSSLNDLTINIDNLAVSEQKSVADCLIDIFGLPSMTTVSLFISAIEEFLMTNSDDDLAISYYNAFKNLRKNSGKIPFNLHNMQEFLTRFSTEVILNSDGFSSIASQVNMPSLLPFSTFSFKNGNAKLSSSNIIQRLLKPSSIEPFFISLHDPFTVILERVTFNRNNTSGDLSIFWDCVMKAFTDFRKNSSHQLAYLEVASLTSNQKVPTVFTIREDIVKISGTDITIPYLKYYFK